MTLTLPTGSPAFSFQLQGGPLVCPAFSLPFKLLAVAMVTLALAWGTHMWSTGLLEWTLNSSGWLVAALAMMSYTVWHILNGITTLDDKALQQTWVWRKRVELHELAYAKLIRVRHFEWLIAPRLYTRTYSNKLAVFYAISPAMLQEFQRIEAALKERSLQN
jgi:hypothetical protein